MGGTKGVAASFESIIMGFAAHFFEILSLSIGES
jgi:hypothetical protein